MNTSRLIASAFFGVLHKEAGLFSPKKPAGMMTRAMRALKPGRLTRAAMLAAVPAGIAAYGLGRGLTRGHIDLRRAEEDDRKREALRQGYMA